MKYYLNYPQALFFSKQETFMLVAADGLADWEIDADVFLPLVKLQVDYLAKYVVGNMGRKGIRTMEQTKALSDSTQKFKKGLALFINRFIARNTLVKDTDRMALGVPIRKKT